MLLTPDDPENQNFEKLKINTWRYLLFYSSFTIILLIDMVPEI